MATWGPVELTDTLDDGWEAVGTGVDIDGLDSDGDVVGGRFNIYNHMLLRFDEITIPKGVTINSVTLQVYIGWEKGSAFDIRVYCEDIDDAPQIDTGDNDNISSRTKTTAYSTWEWPYSGDGSYTVTDPKAAVQEVINRDGWSNGNAIAFILESQTADDSHWGQIEDVDTITGIAHAAQLTINYTEGGTLYYQSADGAFAPTGVLVKNTKTGKVGNFTLTGIITKKGFVPKAGAVTFSGAAMRLPKKGLAGAFTFAGSLGKAISVSLAGVLTATGALAASLVGAIQQAVGGVLTFSGAVVNKAAKALGGTLALNGAVVKKMMTSLAGVFVAAGSVSNILTKVKSLAGVLSFSGSISKLTSVSLVGILTFTGSIGKTIRRALAGVLSFVGSGIGRLLGIGPQELVEVSGEFTQLVSLSGEIMQVVEVEGEFTQIIEVSGELLED